MDFSALGSSGVKHGPQFNIFAGIQGIGKTTLALQYPRAVAADLEDGSKGIDVLKRFSPKDLPDFATLKSFLSWIRNAKHDYLSLTLDSMVKLESYIHVDLCGKKYDSIEKYEGGFGKGFTAARERGLETCEIIRDIINNREMDVNLIAHTQIKKQADPYDNTEYDRYILQGNEKFTQIFSSQADNVFFMKRVVFTETNSKTKKTMASFDGQRVIVTEWRPGADAKNRLNLPAEIHLPRDKDLAYATLKKAIESARNVTPDQLRADIKELLTCADKETVEKANGHLATCGDSIEDLKFIKEKVMEVVKF